MTLTHHGPGPEPYYRRTPVDWQALRDDLLALYREHPGSWLKVETAIINGDRYLAHRIRTNPALNDLSVDQFRRKAFPQKNRRQKLQGWEIWLRLGPVHTKLRDERVAQERRELLDFVALLDTATKERDAQREEMIAEGNRVHREIRELANWPTSDNLTTDHPLEIPGRANRYHGRED